MIWVFILKQKEPTYRILKDKKLIIEYYYGDIYFDDIIHIKRIMSEDKDYNPRFNTLLDFSDSKLILQDNEIKEVVDFLHQNKKVTDDRKTVLLTNTPNQVVLTMLSKDLPMHYDIVSTIDGALNWINHREDRKTIIDILNYFKIKNNYEIIGS